MYAPSLASSTESMDMVRCACVLVCLLVIMIDSFDAITLSEQTHGMVDETKDDISQTTPDRELRLSQRAPAKIPFIFHFTNLQPLTIYKAYFSIEEAPMLDIDRTARFKVMIIDDR